MDFGVHDRVGGGSGAQALKECRTGCGTECPRAELRLVGLSSADSLTGPRVGPACICLQSGLPARTLRPAARRSALRCGPVSLPRARRSKKDQIAVMSARRSLHFKMMGMCV